MDAFWIIKSSFSLLVQNWQEINKKIVQYLWWFLSFVHSMDNPVPTQIGLTIPFIKLLSWKRNSYKKKRIYFFLNVVKKNLKEKLYYVPEYFDTANICALSWHNVSFAEICLVFMLKKLNRNSQELTLYPRHKTVCLFVLSLNS